MKVKLYESTWKCHDCKALKRTWTEEEDPGVPVEFCTFCAYAFVPEKGTWEVSEPKPMFQMWLSDAQLHELPSFAELQKEWKKRHSNVRRKRKGATTLLD